MYHVNLTAAAITVVVALLSEARAEPPRESGAWRAECHDPTDADQTVSQYREDKVTGIFCGKLANVLGFNQDFDKACRNLRGKSNGHGWCKITLDLYQITNRRPLFCQGVPNRSALAVRILIQEHAETNKETIFNYEWNVAGSEMCELWKISHEARDGISKSIDQERNGSGDVNDDDPSLLRSTKLLQSIYVATWQAVSGQTAAVDYNCIVYPTDR